MSFTEHTRDQHANSIADYLPNGPLFRAKKLEDSQLRDLLYGLARQILIAEGKLIQTQDELDINTAEDLIEEWESQLGIPDECFLGDGDLEERRQHVLIKLNSSVQTEQDFVDLAAALGIPVTISSGIEFSVFPLTFPFLFFDSQKQARFTMIVDFNVGASNEFPQTFPITFDDKGTTIVRCLFDKLKPANVNIIYREVT